MASVKILLKKNKTNKDGSHPIVLQIIKDRKRKFLWLGHSAKPDQWDSNKNIPKSSHPNSTRLKNLLLRKLSEVEGLILDFENLEKPFTVDDIIDKLTIDEKSEFLFAFSEKEISKMISLRQSGNAAVYQNTLNVYKEFRKRFGLGW